MVSGLAFAQTQLTEKVLENLISTAKELEKLQTVKGKELYEEEGDEDSDSLDITPEKIIMAVKRSGSYDEVSRIVSKHGFHSVDEWAGLYSRTIKAMMATVMVGMADYQSQMKAQMEQMLANPDLTSEQKQAIMSMMQPAKLPEAPPADPQDMQDIAPYLERLKQGLAPDDEQ